MNIDIKEAEQLAKDADNAWERIERIDVVHGSLVADVRSVLRCHHQLLEMIQIYVAHSNQLRNTRQA